MALFIAYNSALSTTTNIDNGTSYATGAKVALQLNVPDNGQILLVEWGCSFNGSAAATPATLEVATTDTATTAMTAHSTTTVKSVDYEAAAGPSSRLTMGTGATAYGAVAITSNTTLRPIDRQFVAPTNQYVKMWPLGREPVIGSGATESFLQFRVNTSATVNMILYAVWEEHI